MVIDKAFAAYATAITVGSATVVTCAIIGLGGTFPPLEFLVGHLMMSLTFRAAYKSLAGRDLLLPVLSFVGFVRDAAPVEERAEAAGATA